MKHIPANYPKDLADLGDRWKAGATTFPLVCCEPDHISFLVMTPPKHFRIAFIRVTVDFQLVVVRPIALEEAQDRDLREPV